MSWTCPQDGNDVADDVPMCPRCYYPRLPMGVSLTSDATGKTIDAHVETLFGASNLKRLDETEAKYLSGEQFRLLPWVDQGGWAVVPVLSATNPTHLNDAPIEATGALLKPGDRLSIKGKYFKLTVGLL